MRIAVCGKGGVGKTTVSALLARRLARTPERTALLVDADHAGGLGVALDLEPRVTLEQIRQQALSDLRARTASARTDVPAGIDYQLQEALCERGHLAFLSLGRPEQPGCYCAANALLREALVRLSALFEVTLIDAEAGLEQLNREVLGPVDRLLLVADPTVKALRVAAEAARLARQMDAAREVALLLNRVRPEPDASRNTAAAQRHFAAGAPTAPPDGCPPLPADLPLLGHLPEDPVVRRYDAEGRSLLDLPDSAATRALDALAPRILSPGGALRAPTRP